MPSITLKNLPHDLHRDLKQRARARQSSLNKEVIMTLRAATAPSVSLEAAPLNEKARRLRSLFRRYESLYCCGFASAAPATLEACINFSDFGHFAQVPAGQQAQ